VERGVRERREREGGKGEVEREGQEERSGK